jgi:Flp pilus assembly protein TadD
MHRSIAGVVSLVCVVAVAGCGKKEQAAPAAGQQKPAAAAADAGAATAAPTAPGKPKAGKPAAAKPSKEQLKTYRTHLRAGRKLGKDKKWGEAAAEFEKALAALPGDARALSELGWAAFNAGDYAKARKANADSVKQAIDKNVKAASLYNLGRVEEATGNKEAAAKLYQESLTLRPNKIVAERLKSLGGKEPEPGPAPAGDELACGKPMPLEAICGCLKQQAEELDEDGAGADAAELGCEVEPEGKIPGVRVVSADMSDMEQTHVLAAKVPGGWAVVTVLEDVYNPGAFGISESWELVSMEQVTVGGKQLLRITTKKSRHDSDLGINEEEDEETTSLTVCVLGDDKTATTCPLSLPLSARYVRDRIFDESELDEEEKAHIKEYGSKDLPIKEELELDVTIADDGTATVVLKKGAASEWVKHHVGQQKLW